MRRIPVMHVPAGGCGGCALELALVQLWRCGASLVTEPRHAQILLVTGTVGRSMTAPVVAAWSAMADPKWLVAVGDCAIGAASLPENYAVGSGIDTHLPVALSIPGRPPDPETILAGLSSLVRAILSPPASEVRDLSVSEPSRPVLLPAAPRHRLSGDGSSSG